MIILLATVVTSCLQLPKNSQSVANQPILDGAPKHPLPLAVKPVKPVYEPFSRYGNPESYAVNGHIYKVMRTAKGYKAKGTASWYGTKFHSQRTSSGDYYNMYAMTAAHRTLPIPTYLRVKNLLNGKQVIVKVNDRGPFHADRIIDLSYAAASQLGLLPKGTVPVEIEAIVVPYQGKPPVAHYFVQAGAYSVKKTAAGLQQKIAKLTSSPVFIEQRQKQFIVKIGPFADKNLSQSLIRKLTALGLHGFTVLH